MRGTTVRAPLRPRQLRVKKTGRPRSGIEPGPEILKLGLQREAVVVRGMPIDVARRQDGGVQVSVGEDGAHLAVPGAPERAAVGDDGRDAAVGGRDGRVDDVDAVLVGERCVGAFPGRDAAAAAAEGDLGVRGPEGAEAWAGVVELAGILSGRNRARAGE